MPRVFLPLEHFRKPFCPHYHYKPHVGIESYNRSCWACHIATTRRNNRARRAKAREGRPPTYQDARGFKVVREELGLTKPGFARAIGCGVQTVYDWESGKKRISMISIERYLPIISDLLKQHRLREGTYEHEEEDVAA